MLEVVGVTSQTQRTVRIHTLLGIEACQRAVLAFSIATDLEVAARRHVVFVPYLGHMMMVLAKRRSEHYGVIFVHDAIEIR